MKTPGTMNRTTSLFSAESATCERTEDLNNLDSSPLPTSRRQWPPAGVKPYYSDDSVCIILGDCRDVLSAIDSVDLLLTDPPYGLGDQWQGGSRWPLHHIDGMKWDQETISPNTLHFVRRWGKQQIIWGGHYYADCLPVSRSWLIWDKLERNDKFTSGQAEMAWTNFDQPLKVWRSHSTSELTQGGKCHPTQKPLELISWCLSFTSAQTVLDPFMGSGTTLRAAKDLGRKAIGIEIEEKYCEIAAKRMSQEVLQLGMVTPIS